MHRKPLLTFSSFYYVVFLHLVAWIYCWVVSQKFARESPSLDWTDQLFAEGFFVILLWSMQYSQAFIETANALTSPQTSHSNLYRIGSTILCQQRQIISLNYLASRVFCEGKRALHKQFHLVSIPVIGTAAESRSLSTPLC